MSPILSDRACAAPCGAQELPLSCPDQPTWSSWKPELYRIQLQAPTAVPLPPAEPPEDPPAGPSPPEGLPAGLGPGYHGLLSHGGAAALLQRAHNGSYLTRKGKPDNAFYTLSWRFNDEIQHFKLWHEAGELYVKEKRYGSVQELVAEGLLVQHMELHARHILNHMHQQPKPGLGGGAGEQARGGPHEYRLHTFKGLNWCQHCDNFLWGFTAQGVKCQECGFIAHSKCSSLAVSGCPGSGRSVFGCELSPAQVPHVVTRCIAEVEARGLQQEGIYRISGFADEIEALKQAFDRDGASADLSKFSNINVVSGCLKLFLRSLPVPLCGSCVLQEQQHEAGWQQRALSLLPAPHLPTLRAVLRHLHRVQQQQQHNKMSAHNLSTVLAPTLLAVTHTDTHVTAQIHTLHTLILHAPALFP